MEPQLRPGAREAIFAQLAQAGRAEQVARRLTDAIILGVLTLGERLPSEQELARRFGVALITVREALVMLRDAGLVETRRGREGGSFVIKTDARHETLPQARLRDLAQVELSDLTVFVSTIIEDCAERAALRASPPTPTGSARGCPPRRGAGLRAPGSRPAGFSSSSRC
ncbi:MAG: winged helix-turn-helix domain-containing protein [Cryobacterium sp.]|nr:winged helix-turn-helix domain-containing protein [Cryobacterium sp.]